VELRYQTEDEFYARLRQEYLQAEGEQGEKVLQFVLKNVVAEGTLEKRHLVTKDGMTETEWAELTGIAAEASARADAVQELKQYEAQALAAAKAQRQATASRARPKVKDDKDTLGDVVGDISRGSKP